jgi:hypothetical protein
MNAELSPFLNDPPYDVSADAFPQYKQSITRRVKKE